MTDAQMAEIHQQFANINQRFDQVDQRFGGIDERLGGIDQRFDGIDARFNQVDGQIAGLRKDVKDVQEDVAANSVMLQRVDAEVHRRGIELERHTHELKLAIEQFQSLQKVMNTKLDIERKSIEQRLDPIEDAVRNHSAQLTQHSRRLDRLEHE